MSERRPDRKGKSWKDTRTRKIKEERTLEVADLDILHLQGLMPCPHCKEIVSVYAFKCNECEKDLEPQQPNA
jgi:hypothetical protein